MYLEKTLLQQIFIATISMLHCKLILELPVNMNITLSNREIATIIWFSLFFVYFLSKKKLRSFIPKILKIILRVDFLLFFYSYFAFLFLVTSLLYYFNLWDIIFLKESIIWFIFSGLPIGVSVATNMVNSNFWKKLVIDNLKLLVLVEFIINSFVFPLIIELFLLPFIVIIVAINTYTQHHEKFKSIEKSSNIALSSVGLFILIYSLYMILSNIDSILDLKYAKAFLIPIVYSMVSIPYMYFFKVWVLYKQIFMRLKIGKERPWKLNLLIKLRLILFGNINIKKLQIAASMNYNLMSMSSKNDINDMIESYKLKEKELEKPTYLEFEIYNYFQALCDAEWSKVDLNKPNQIVDEYKITQDVAKHYGISKEDVDYIWLKVSEYQRYKC